MTNLRATMCSFYPPLSKFSVLWVLFKPVQAHRKGKESEIKFMITPRAQNDFWSSVRTQWPAKFILAQSHATSSQSKQWTKTSITYFQKTVFLIFCKVVELWNSGKSLRSLEIWFFFQRSLRSPEKSCWLTNKSDNTLNFVLGSAWTPMSVSMHEL